MKHRSVLLFGDKGSSLVVLLVLQIMSQREKYVRLSEREHEVMEMTSEMIYDGEIPYGAVVERGCKALIQDKVGTIKNEFEEKEGVTF